MRIFEIVKENVNLREAAELYGIDVNRYGKALCPFHNDRNPSLYVADDHYYCFACGEHGDVIDFVGRLFQLSPYNAARKLMADFHLSPDKPPSAAALHAKRIRTEAQQLMENERLCFSVLSDYARVLRDWKMRYTPQSPDVPVHAWFVEACHKLDQAEYYLDILCAGDSFERAEVVQQQMAGGKLDRLRQRLEKFTRRKSKMDMTPQAWPDWYDGKHINEVLFCQQFLDKHPMKCVRGRLFTVDGLIEDEGQIGNLILEEISGVLTSGLSKVVTNLLASIKLQAYSPPLPIETDRIHVSNGTYFIDGSFTVVKSYCNNRLTVAYNPDAPTPKKWLQFLSELLQPEDIPTLQEFLGYCLLPTTKGQKMLMLIGKGGEGKSRIGLVMRSLLGDSMNTTSIQKVESNRFSRADLENKLLMVDDDMDMSALPKTNYIKSIVTSECKMDMERKGVQSYQSQLYVRFLCFGNGALTALHDKSDGFFRRQIVLTTKDRPAGRADDPFLVDKLLREKEGIFLWCLEGLHRLIGDNYQFTVSSKAKENMETVKRSSNNVIEFLQSEGYIRFRADSEASSKAIYEAYTRWCDDNAQKPMSANRVSSELAQNERLYNVEATNNVHVGGKRVRGFMGIEVVNPLPY